MNASSLRFQFTCTQTGVGKNTNRVSLHSFPSKNKGNKGKKNEKLVSERVVLLSEELETFDLFVNLIRQW